MEHCGSGTPKVSKKIKIGRPTDETTKDTITPWLLGRICENNQPPIDPNKYQYMEQSLSKAKSQEERHKTLHEHTT